MRRTQAGAGQRVLPQRFRRLADFALAGQEDQDVAAAQARQFVGGIDDGVVEIALVVILFKIGNRPVTHVDRVEPARHLDHRCTAEMLRKALGVDGRRGDDDFQVRTLGQQLLEVAEQEVDVQAALVRLVDDDRVVGREIRIGLRLGEQDAVGHELDPAVGGRLVLEADFHPDAGADLRLQFLRQARRDRARREPAWLRVADQSGAAAAEFETDFRQLRRLAGAGFAANDDHLVLGDQRRDFRAPLIDRQIGLEFGFGQAGPALFQPGARFLEQGGKIGLQFCPFFPRRPQEIALHAAQAAVIGAQAEQALVVVRPGAFLFVVLYHLPDRAVFRRHLFPAKVKPRILQQIGGLGHELSTQRQPISDKALRLYCQHQSPVISDDLHHGHLSLQQMHPASGIPR